ncbi:MAG: hypothetical protein JETT_3034 [Candidatus Jettenia ecosi]|uniref:Lipoprotein n=1 Tax=Candidatus Jettenia ecosi TaxID=2494326 RepID=A0A533Q7U9_9BACT|nr:MAG: hypothetical protein JETT_3034 [Candidatus Jettenia ecosi]
MRKILGIIAIGIIGITGCVSTPQPPPIPQLTQLEIRQIQAREYESANLNIAMKAVISALQDEGFIIETANPELGLVTAAKEIYEVDKATKNSVEFWQGVGMGTYQTTKRFETSTTIENYGKGIRIRINIVAKAVSNSGGNIWSQPVYDAKIYQDIFSKIDKSVYLEKEKI